MVDTAELRGIITKRGFSQRRLASELGMSDRTFYSRMKKGVFLSTEIEAMIHILQIEDPVPIFFADYVA